MMHRKSLLMLVSASLFILSFGCTKSQNSATPAKAAKPAVASAKKDASSTAKASSSNAGASVSKDGVTIVEASACRSVEQREPVGAAEKFPGDVGRIYIYSKVNVEGAADASIKHVWKFDGKEVATVTLPIRGPQWRTYSSKTINPVQKGSWQVDITAGDGTVLKSVAFAIE